MVVVTFNINQPPYQKRDDSLMQILQVGSGILSNQEEWLTHPTRAVIVWAGVSSSEDGIMQFLER
jgi:hypothetical protein